MIFTQKYSGSTGNCYLLELASGQQIVIDPGVPWRKLQKALDHKLDRVECCLASHFHGDHCKAVPDLLKAGIPVYASEPTLTALGVQDHHNAHFLSAGCPEFIGRTSVYAFPTEHDCDGSLGFIVRDNDTKESLLFATDTAMIKHLFAYPFDIIVIECSYHPDILQKRVDEKTIDESLAKRLLDSHMSFDITLSYLKRCNLSRCKEIHIIHCSKENLDMERARKQIEEELFIPVRTIVT